LGNHDGTRLATRFGGQSQARLAAMLLLCLRGTPTMYYGDELGMENGVIPPDKVQDPQGINLGIERTRDVARTPMQWDASPQAGFTTGEPWLPISDDYHTRNVAEQKKDPNSVLNLYRQLLSYRHTSLALTAGNYRPLETGTQDTFTFLRESGDEGQLVVLNFSNRPQLLHVLAGNGQIKISTNLDRHEKISLERVDLRANEGLIIEI